MHRPSNSTIYTKKIVTVTLVAFVVGPVGNHHEPAQAQSLQVKRAQQRGQDQAPGTHFPTRLGQNPIVQLAASMVIQSRNVSVQALRKAAPQITPPFALSKIPASQTPRKSFHQKFPETGKKWIKPRPSPLSALLHLMSRTFGACV